MLFVLTAVDKPNSLELRLATRAAHFEYAKSTGCIRLGGPFLDAKGDMAGSMIVFEAADIDAAKAWAANDPYARAGLFASSDIRPWKLTFNPKGVEF
ncbi:MAG TPA: YciI family protein [Rhizomicrobium sp.]|nr:YciI family protein [Rhizomicrobium sp.]